MNSRAFESTTNLATRVLHFIGTSHARIIRIFCNYKSKTSTQERFLCFNLKHDSSLISKRKEKLETKNSCTQQWNRESMNSDYKESSIMQLIILIHDK